MSEEYVWGVRGGRGVETAYVEEERPSYVALAAVVMLGLCVLYLDSWVIAAEAVIVCGVWCGHLNLMWLSTATVAKVKLLRGARD